MKVAVVTPCFSSETTHLKQCINSVQQQTYSNILHILINDGGHPLPKFNSPNLETIDFSRNFNDYGDSPRAIGAFYAFARGVDAVCFLDSDNWFLPEHLESLVKLQQRLQIPFVSSYRLLASVNGDIMGPCGESDGFHFCDTNTMFFTREISSLATSWCDIDSDQHAIGDRLIWDKIVSSGINISCTDLPTVVYRTRFIHHYEFFNTEIPESAVNGSHIAAFLDQIETLQNRAAILAKRSFIQT
ncbi:hypothetical protein TDB9533_03490 [Thalassocella blandensis]|nr:hypothetical protein TDB9533_03490 [Thalassocella blandensis]